MHSTERDMLAHTLTRRRFDAFTPDHVVPVPVRCPTCASTAHVVLVLDVCHRPLWFRCEGQCFGRAWHNFLLENAA